MKTIYLKLTTVPQSPTREILDLYQKKYSKVKDFQIRKDVEDSFREDGGLNPLFGKIYSIQIGFVSDSTLRIQILKGEEKDILIEFINLLNGDFFSSFDVATWSAKYTLPFLTTRIIHNKLNIKAIPRVLQHLGMKPWNIKTVDVSDYIEGVGYYKGNIEEHYFNLTGEVIESYGDRNLLSLLERGQGEVIDRNDVKHVEALAKIYLAFLGEDTFSKVESTTKVLGEVKEEKLSGIEMLVKRGVITDSLREEILEKGEPTEEEKKHLKDIILANVVPEKSKKSVFLEKEKEVDSFIESLKK